MTSSIILRNELVESILEFVESKMIVHISSRDLLIIHDWRVVKEIIEPVYSNT